jgi:hypothetical protein
MVESDLRTLSEYFLVFAPDEVQEDQVPGIADPVPLAQFRPAKPPMDLPADELITLTHWDAGQQNFYIGRGAHHALQVFDRTGRLMLNKSCDSEPVGVESLENGFRLSLLGDFLEDKERGQVMDVIVSDNDQLQTKTLVEGYHRLTQTLSVDLNQDGRMDLLMVNGNNMEIKNAPLKPYHGIRILLRKGERLEFEERHFYPMHGAIKAVAEDFDLDGDMDLAAIAFYPDWSLDNPQTFVYLENKGAQGLQASVPTQEHWGRWMTMDAGDFNRDGFPDILLGGAYVKHGVHSDYQEQYQQLPHPSLMIMENLRGDQAISKP